MATMLTQIPELNLRCVSNNQQTDIEQVFNEIGTPLILCPLACFSANFSASTSTQVLLI